MLIDYKALAGDSSDEIPGVAGIGPKTATELIKEFGSVESIYTHLKDIKPAVTAKLTVHQDMAFLSKKLATIDKQVPIVFKEKDSRLREYDKEKVIELFKQLEFTTLISRLPSDNWESLVEDTLLTKLKVEHKEKTDNDKQMSLF